MHFSYTRWFTLPQVFSEAYASAVCPASRNFLALLPRSRPSSFINPLWCAERWSKTHHFAGTQKLHEMIQQPYDLFKPGWADQYVVGMINQVAQAMDDFITSQVIVYVNRTSLYEQ